MCLTTVELEVANPRQPERRVQVEALVDSGAILSVVPEAILRELGIAPVEERRFFLADGSAVTRRVGNAHWFYAGRETVAPVLFGEEGDATLLGALTMEALGLALDPCRRGLRPAVMRMG